MLEEQGEPGVTIENVAQRLRACKHDFQRYFCSVAELRDSILEYWEQALTNDIANAAKPEDIPPGDRIFGVMERVIESDAGKSRT